MGRHCRRQAPSPQWLITAQPSHVLYAEQQSLRRRGTRQNVELLTQPKYNPQQGGPTGPSLFFAAKRPGCAALWLTVSSREPHRELFASSAGCVIAYQSGFSTATLSPNWLMYGSANPPNFGYQWCIRRHPTKLQYSHHLTKFDTFFQTKIIVYENESVTNPQNTAYRRLPLVSESRFLRNIDTVTRIDWHPHVGCCL